MITLGDKIYRQRKQKGFSQEELASRIGVTRQTVSKWETNSMQPTFDNVKSMSMIFDVDIDYFANEEATSDDKSQEIAISKEEKKAKDIAIVKKKYLGILICIILTSVFFITSGLITVAIAQMVFTNNTGDYEVIISSSFNITSFVVSLVFLILFAVLDTAFIVLFVYKKSKCNVKLTKCKEQ